MQQINGKRKRNFFWGLKILGFLIPGESPPLNPQNPRPFPGVGKRGRRAGGGLPNPGPGDFPSSGG